MLKVSDNQKRLLLEYLPNVEQYIENTNIDRILEELDDKITEVGFDANYELNEVGLKLQELYDQLYNQN